MLNKYISGVLSDFGTPVNPLDEIKNQRFFKYMATSFSIKEKKELFRACEELFSDYPLLSKYEITLLGVGAGTAGEIIKEKDKKVTILLGDNPQPQTVIHELGHIISWNTRKSRIEALDLSFANEYEVSVYALTDKTEMFCELIANKYCSKDRLKQRTATRILDGIKIGRQNEIH